MNSDLVNPILYSKLHINQHGVDIRHADYLRTMSHQLAEEILIVVKHLRMLELWTFALSLNPVPQLLLCSCAESCHLCSQCSLHDTQHVLVCLWQPLHQHQTSSSHFHIQLNWINSFSRSEYVFNLSCEKMSLERPCRLMQKKFLQKNSSSFDLEVRRKD